jgi:hypothetical protein
MKLVLVALGIARIVCHGNKPMFLVLLLYLFETVHSITLNYHVHMRALDWKWAKGSC